MLRPLPADVSAGATRTLGLGAGRERGKEGAKKRVDVPQFSVLGSVEEYTAQVAAHSVVSRERGRGVNHLCSS